MTLLIAGYNHQESFDNQMRISGLFAVADSAITANQSKRTLLNGYKKIYHIKAELWKPDFMPNDSFNGYRVIYEYRSLFIGFAGNTLTAQHIINSITEHLSQLRISCYYEEPGGIRYNVIRHCQSNPLNSTAHYWDIDLFADNDLQNILTGEVIASHVEHSMNIALKSARRYKLSEPEFNELRTDFIAGVWCPTRDRHELYLFRMLERTEDGILTAYTKKHLVPETEVVVLGMKRDFESAAQVNFAAALKARRSPVTEMQSFINNAIDTVQDTDSKEIDRPIFGAELAQNSIRTLAPIR